MGAWPRIEALIPRMGIIVPTGAHETGAWEV